MFLGFFRTSIALPHCGSLCTGFAHISYYIYTCPTPLLGFFKDPVYIVACQVHPALVKWSRVTRFYVNVSRLVHLRTVSCQRRSDGFYWRPRLPGTRQYISYHIFNVYIIYFCYHSIWITHSHKILTIQRGGPCNLSIWSIPCTLLWIKSV